MKKLKKLKRLRDMNIGEFGENMPNNLSLIWWSIRQKMQTFFGVHLNEPTSIWVSLGSNVLRNLDERRKRIED